MSRGWLGNGLGGWVDGSRGGRFVRRVVARLDPSATVQDGQSSVKGLGRKYRGQVVKHPAF